MRTNIFKLLMGAIIAFFTFTDNAFALPSFAKQTGLDCTACHTIFPELTPVGRDFKLRGYTLSSGESKMPIPLAAMLTVAGTQATSGKEMNKNGQVVVPQASLFYGGKIMENLGMFAQLTYDGSELTANKDISHHVAMDNVDIRYARSFALGSKEVVYGITVNNNPTVTDLWNSVPAWSFPYASSSTAEFPASSTLVDGGLTQSVAGVSAYALWADWLYTEIAVYTSAHTGALNLFAWKHFQKGDDPAVVKGSAPYARVALQHMFGDHYIMLGGYGLWANMNPNAYSNSSGKKDKYTDLAMDAQYQYTNGKNIVALTASKIWEKQKFNATETTNSQNSLTTSKARVSYYYAQKYGVSAGFFDTSGRSDDTLYAADPYSNDSPNSRGSVYELNYLPAKDIKVSLQYDNFNKFNGASGHEILKKNHVLLHGWFMF